MNQTGVAGAGLQKGVTGRGLQEQGYGKWLREGGYRSRVTWRGYRKRVAGAGLRGGVAGRGVTGSKKGCRKGLQERGHSCNPLTQPLFGGVGQAAGQILVPPLHNIHNIKTMIK